MRKISNICYEDDHNSIFGGPHLFSVFFLYSYPYGSLSRLMDSSIFWSSLTRGHSHFPILAMSNRQGTTHLAFDNSLGVGQQGISLVYLVLTTWPRMSHADKGHMVNF